MMFNLNHRNFLNDHLANYSKVMHIARWTDECKATWLEQLRFFWENPDKEFLWVQVDAYKHAYMNIYHG